MKWANDVTLESNEKTERSTRFIHWSESPKEAANDLRRGGYTTYKKVDYLARNGDYPMEKF